MEKLSKRRRLGGLLHRCSRTMYFHSQWGIRQFEIMKMLQNGPMQQKDIREILGIGQAATSELITKLEEKHFVERTRSEEDRRIALIKITGKGRHEIEQREAMPSFDIGELPLTDGEMDTLIALLEKLEADFKEKEQGSEK